MTTPKELFTLSVFTENKPGLLHRISALLSRRRINLESIAISASEKQGVHKYILVFEAEREQALKITAQIDKQVEELSVRIHTDQDLVHQELALFKLELLAVPEAMLDQILKQERAHILELGAEYVVIEKTGRPNELQSLFEKLKPFGMIEFSRSGRVSVARKQVF
ncbi:MAG TPA: acetolactate synthase small subunit [Bacteroidia bacterium]|jgi:acetolactate synthase-1/3 small subunit|nr:acetolactate synthase small subunit [Bacteroidia bacterium]